MKNAPIITFVLFFLFGNTSAPAQIDYSVGFLNFKRSLTSSFLNGEFQVGNSDEMHFLSVTGGVQFSKYESEKYCPYYTGTIDLSQFYKFSKYQSRKQGMQAGLGYAYYFRNLENEEDFIPFIGLEMMWMLVRDRYQITYTHETNGDEQQLPEESTAFHTLSSELNFGFIYALKKIFFKGCVTAGYYLPVNNNDYMATDKYNIYSSRKLPLAGIEPSLQAGIGFRL